jgi:DNA-binding NtrC family response regulator
MARITVIDDYPDFLDLMTGILAEMAGHQIIGFDTSESTVEDLLLSHPDLLIVDLSTARAVVRDRPALAVRSRQVPIIVCSGDPEALADWVSNFDESDRIYPLPKPFSLDDLVEMVDSALAPAGARPSLVTLGPIAAT